MKAYTALRADKENTRTITFKNQEHENFYNEYLKKCRYQDEYHKALVYCLGINDSTRRNIKLIYDFKTGNLRTECLHDGWITSGSAKVVRMAFNLYNSGMPSVYDYDDAEEQLSECKRYTVEDLFCCEYAKYFWEAIKVRYPEYCFYQSMEDMFEW